MVETTEQDWIDYVSRHVAVNMRSVWPALSECIERCVEALAVGGKIMFCGNGGSFAMAQHLAAELVGNFERPRRPLRAVALGSNGATVTALSNDASFASALSRELEATAEDGDVLIALSTSGESSNVRLALEDSVDIWTSLWTSSRYRIGPEPAEDHAIIVPTDNTAICQVMHLMMGHFLCKEIERRCTT